MIGYNIADKKFYYIQYAKGGIWHNITHESNGIKFSYTYINEENMRKDWLLPSAPAEGE